VEPLLSTPLPSLDSISQINYNARCPSWKTSSRSCTRARTSERTVCSDLGSEVLAIAYPVTLARHWSDRQPRNSISCSIHAAADVANLCSHCEAADCCHQGHITSCGQRPGTSTNAAGHGQDPAPSISSRTAHGTAVTLYCSTSGALPKPSTLSEATDSQLLSSCESWTISALIA
jgi:hypothetical protein